MDDRFQALAAEAARRVLQSFRESYRQWTDDKIPLDKLAAWLGLEIAKFGPDDYPKGTYGFLEPRENLIWLNRELPDGMLRFTLAHEIGHAILHRQAELRESAPLPRTAVEFEDQRKEQEDQCKEQDVREGVTDLLFQDQVEEQLGIGISYDPRSQREIAANVFAAELLMPLERLRTLYLSAETPASELVAIFGVSRTALLNRLSEFLTPGETDVLREVDQAGNSLKGSEDHIGVDDS